MVVFTLLFTLGCVSHGLNPERAPSALVVDASGYAYRPGDTSCDGYPRLNVGTAPGTCLGLVLPRTGQNLIMPRTILQLHGSSDFLLIDMGGWKANNGALYLLKPRGQLVKLKGGLNMPHGLNYGMSGWIYVGESTKIWRFQWVNGEMRNVEMVFDKLDRVKGYMHPLTQFAFNYTNGDMFVNYGSPTDHCFDPKKGEYQVCNEGDNDGHAAILRIPGKLLAFIPERGVHNSEFVASGLRNSMAMVVHPTGTLVQGENSRDFPELEEPYEELNVIPKDTYGMHYGWPYCYNFHGQSPEWKYPENAKAPMRQKFQAPADCRPGGTIGGNPYQPPWALLPPHSAPLNLDYYNGAMFPQWQGRLLASLHGYQPTGHRLVAFPVDSLGRPVTVDGAKGTKFSFDQKGRCAIQKEFAARGGVERTASYEEIIHTWDQVKGVRPKGAPVGFTVAMDGSIYIVEDRENRTVLRLARTNEGPVAKNCDAPATDFEDPRIELLAWRRTANRNPQVASGLQALQEQIVGTYCASCHGGFKETDIAADKYMLLDFLVKNEWVVPGHPKESKIVQAIAQTGEFPGMPPADKPQILGNPVAEKSFAALKTWIEKLPQDVSKTFQKIEIASNRRVRDAAGAGAKECGLFEAGDSVYVNPGNRVTKDGWVWTETYIVPGDTRLFQQRCAYPNDGVFWMALVKAK